MKKTITNKNTEVRTIGASGTPKVDIDTFAFPINSQFILGNVLYRVTRMREEGPEEWRTVLSAENGDQDFLLTTLRKDAKLDPSFMIVDTGTPKEDK